MTLEELKKADRKTQNALAVKFINALDRAYCDQYGLEITNKVITRKDTGEVVYEENNA